MSFAALAFDPLAIVFKVSLPAREAFLRFVQRCLEAFEFRARSDELRQIGTSETRVVHSGVGRARF